jgi:hypothetical protein
MRCRAAFDLSQREFTAACGTDQICHPVETVPDYNVAAHGPGRGMFGWVHQSASVARMKN